MKRQLNKKVIFVAIGMFVWQSIILPIKLLAMEYQPLEAEAFGNTITNTSSLGDFLSKVFSFGLAIAAALAVIMIIWGGVEIMLSESPFGKTNGKEKIWNAIWGLVLALFSWLILYTINPEILNFKL